MIRLLFALILGLAALGPALADDMAVYVRNEAGADIALELHGHGTVWPGGGKVYQIEKGYRKSIPIECEAGERICYAAWLVGNDAVSWGLGPDNDQTCDNCCSICVAKSTMTIELAR